MMTELYIYIRVRLRCRSMSHHRWFGSQSGGTGGWPTSWQDEFCGVAPRIFGLEYGDLRLVRLELSWAALLEPYPTTNLEVRSGRLFIACLMEDKDDQLEQIKSSDKIESDCYMSGGRHGSLLPPSEYML